MRQARETRVSDSEASQYEPNQTIPLPTTDNRDSFPAKIIIHFADEVKKVN